MSSVVNARGLSDRYGRTEVLRGVDFDISPGLTALLGPNGAGKTTLLRLLCGLRRPSGGSVSVLGVGEDDRHRRRRIAERVGFLPQSVGYLPAFTVNDFVSYAAWLKKVPSARLAAQVTAAVAAVGLADRAGSRLRTLSGGMIRRVGIATAIVHRPALVVLDEPSAGLDPEQRRDLRLLLHDVAQTSSVILSTHLIEDVRATCDAVVVLEDGAIRFTGSPTDLEAVPRGPNAGSGPPSIEAGYLSVLTGRQDR